MMLSATTRKLILALTVVSAVGISLTCAGAVALVTSFRPSITIDADAVHHAIRAGIIFGLKDGPASQKLDLIRVVRDLGADAHQFTPALRAALDDEDAGVRKAAAEALKQIDLAVTDRVRSALAAFGACSTCTLAGPAGQGPVAIVWALLPGIGN